MANVEKSIAKTSAWFYFVRNKLGDSAICKRCNRELKTFGGSTSGLHKHLKSIHGINLLKRSSEDTTTSKSNLEQVDKTLDKPKKSVITNYFNSHRDNTLAAVLARMTAVDGMPFRIFITSIELRKSLIARGFDLPKSANTIRNMVMKYAGSVREMLTSKLMKLKSEWKRFSLTFDEWTSNRNRRYLNFNVHIEKIFWSLGMVRVSCSLPAEKCIVLIDSMLKRFKLNYDEDVVGITTDGVVKCLEPVKLAVEALCRRDATLLSANTTLSFMMNNIGNSELDVELKTALSRRINERRTYIFSLLQYLHKGHQAYPLLNYENLKKSVIANNLYKLIERLQGSKHLVNTPDIEESLDSDNAIEMQTYSMEEKLNMVIDSENNLQLEKNEKFRKSVEDNKKGNGHI